MIKIPSDFKLMDTSMIASKYSRNNIKPTEVYTNSNADINITLNLMPQSLKENEVAKYGRSSIKQISSLKEVRAVKGDIETIKGKKVVVIEFYSKALDGYVYNLMFIASVGGKVMLGSFNCVLGVASQWQNTAHAIINSIKIN